MNPRSGIDPEIAEWSVSPFWGRYRFSERLNLMYIFVSAELGLYEYDCTGETAKPDLMTDTFRAESDARRAEGFFQPVIKKLDPAVEWVAAGKPKRSTVEKFRGVDYPPEGPGLVGR